MAGELILRSEIKLRSSSIFLKIFGSKIWKVSRCRPAVSNETILAVRQELLFTKNTSRTKHNWHCIIGFLINAALLNVFFNLLYHLFFCKEIYFFECLYFSEYDIRMSLYVFLVEKGAINHVRTQLATSGRLGAIKNACSCV